MKRVMIVIFAVLLPFGAFAEEDIGFGTRAEQEKLTQELRARENASWTNLHARISQKIERAFRLPQGSLRVQLTDDYGSYVSVYLYTSQDGSVQCAAVPTSNQDFGVSCNGRAMFSIRR